MRESSARVIEALKGGDYVAKGMGSKNRERGSVLGNTRRGAGAWER